MAFPAIPQAQGQVRGVPQEDASAPPVARPDMRIDEARAKEREHLQKLRRARADLEARRAEAARRLEAREARLREMARLQSAVSTHARRESHLSHDAWWAQRERESLPWEPADHSGVARRSTLDRRLIDQRLELGRTGSLLQRETTRLDALMFRRTR